MYSNLSITQQGYLGKDNDLGKLDLAALLRIMEVNRGKLVSPNLFNPSGNLIFSTRKIRNKYSHKSVMAPATSSQQASSELKVLHDFLKIIGVSKEALDKILSDIDTFRNTQKPEMVVPPIQPSIEKSDLSHHANEIEKIQDAIHFPSNLQEYLIFQYRAEYKKAENVPFPASMVPSIRDFLITQKQIHSLRIHQAEMFECLINGKNIIVTTSTASGKTLGFELPILQTILTNPRSRALLIYPTKALGYDQYFTLQNDTAFFGEKKIVVGRYDGDTNYDEKQETLKNANIILTNPDTIHTSTLPWKSKWKTVLDNLRYVVIDELHSYQGAFGAHVANVIKRLNRICEFYNSKPQFVCCSATIGNPVELAQNITGQPMQLIDRDGSPQPPRNYYFFDGKSFKKEKSDETTVSGESPTARTRGHINLAAQGIAELCRRKSTFIAFVKARQSVDRLRNEARRETKNSNIRGFSSKDSSEFRQETVNILKSGDFYDCPGVIATNALELGIDIGSIQTVIMAGFPRTKASFRQQAGRAGRGNEDKTTHCILISDNSPINRFVNHQPKWVFNDKQMESVIINPNHESIQLQHLRAAAHELALNTTADEKWFPHIKEKIGQLVREGYLRKSTSSQKINETQPEHVCYESTEDSPSQLINLRCTSDSVYVFEPINEEDEERHPVTLEESQALRELYKGAVYSFNDRVYLVIENNKNVEHAKLKARKVNVARGVLFENHAYYTRPLQSSAVTILMEQDQRNLCGTAGLSSTHLRLGDVEIKTRVDGFRICKHDNRIGEVVIGYQKYAGATKESMAPHGSGTSNWEKNAFISETDWNNTIRLWEEHLRFSSDDCLEAGQQETKATWVELPPRFYALFSNTPTNSKYQNTMTFDVGKKELFTAVGNALHIAAKVKCMCGDSDLAVYFDITNQTFGRNPTSHLEGQGKEYLCFYDLFPGGLGFAEEMYRNFEGIVRFALDNIRNCSCQYDDNEGCPDCVGPIESGSDLQRKDIIYILEGYLDK